MNKTLRVVKHVGSIHPGVLQGFCVIVLCLNVYYPRGRGKTNRWLLEVASFSAMRILTDDERQLAPTRASDGTAHRCQCIGGEGQGTRWCPIRIGDTTLRNVFNPCCPEGQAIEGRMPDSWQTCVSRKGKVHPSTSPAARGNDRRARSGENVLGFLPAYESMEYQTPYPTTLNITVSLTIGRGSTPCFDFINEENSQSCPRWLEE